MILLSVVPPPYLLYSRSTDNLDINYNRRVKVASRQEIELGKATFLSGIDGQVKEYELQY